MAQRSRCPGGRPSVSANKRIHDVYYSVVKWQLYKPSINTEYDQQSPRECRYLYWRVQQHPAILQLIVLTKENKAAHAVAEHLVWLEMPLHSRQNEAIGWILQAKPQGFSTLHLTYFLLTGTRSFDRSHFSLRSGFQQECSQQLSPVATVFFFFIAMPD